jgi:hypothetical protein
MAVLGAAMFAAAVATAMAHGPRLLAIVFFVLMPVAGLTGFILAAVGSAKHTAENRRRSRSGTA